MADRPYLPLLRALGAANVRYAIAGGLAVVLHGVPRMTFDLDIVVDLDDENMKRLSELLTREGYQPRVPVALSELADAGKRQSWIDDRNMIAFSLFHPQRTMEEVDVLIAPGVTWSEVAASMEQRPINGDTVQVIGRELLRKMKLATGREKDKADAELLA